MKLIPREVGPLSRMDTHFKAMGVKTAYSVVDIGKIMRGAAEALGKPADYWEKMGVFLGWEAIPMDALTGEIYYETMPIRAETWDELNKILDANDL